MPFRTRITTYGPGAMVDLPDCSVVIGDLNF
jgi:putative transposon-encoded protein